MSSVTPMKLVPIAGGSSDLKNVSAQFQPISTNEVVVKKQNSNNNLTNLDSELLEILHNKDLSDDAKAKLYWIALHKSEVYKDKSMWSEPTIVELRENRFIPIPVTKPINIPKNDGKRKLEEPEEILSNKRKKGAQFFNPDVDLETTGITEPQSVISKPSRKRKNLSPADESEQQLKKMALINRIQTGHISQEEVERQMEKIESGSPEQEQETESIAGPLVVTGYQDEPQPSTSLKYTPAKFSISENLKEKLLPEWLKIFYNKMDKDTKSFTPYIKSEIKNIIDEIMEKDEKFHITSNSIETDQTIKIKSDPIYLFLHLITGKSSRALTLLKKYLTDLGINFQGGSGLKIKIKKWVKL